MSSDGLIFFYGDYSHPKGEVYPRRIELKPRYSADGLRWASDYRIDVAGHFVDINPELSPTEVNQRIEEIEFAYQHDYQDLGFRLSDGTLTRHKMTNDDQFNLSGNQISYRSWDNQIPTEFANSRSFEIGFQSLMLQSYSSVIYFHEVVQRQGTGGPVWRMTNLWDGTPYKETIYNVSKVVHVQRGTVIGTTEPPAIPEPLWPNEEQEWKRTIIQESPRFHGHLSFLKGTHYIKHYAYYFERIGPDAAGPNFWV